MAIIHAAAADLIHGDMRRRQPYPLAVRAFQMDGRISNSAAIRRCPKCNAFVRVDSGRCVECELLAADCKDDSGDSLSRDSRLSIVPWVSGLGIPLDQLASIIVCVVWLAVQSICLGLADGLFWGFTTLLLPMALIWFSDEIGEFTGFRGAHYVSNECHPSFVKLLGWIGLIATIGYSAYRTFST